LDTRHPDIPDALNKVSERIIGCAIGVHRTLGPGLLERLYEEAMLHELASQNLRVARQVAVPVRYKGVDLHGQRLDLVVERAVVVELKAVEAVADVHLAQLLTYLRVADLPLGLLINFHVPLLTKGVYRRINSQALGRRVSHPDPVSVSSAPSLRPLRSDP